MTAAARTTGETACETARCPTPTPLAVQALGLKSIYIDEVADLNGDGTVDHQDLLLFQQLWHRTATQGGP